MSSLTTIVEIITSSLITIVEIITLSLSTIITIDASSLTTSSLTLLIKMFLGQFDCNYRYLCQ